MRPQLSCGTAAQIGPSAVSTKRCASIDTFLSMSFCKRLSTYRCDYPIRSMTKNGCRLALRPFLSTNAIPIKILICQSMVGKSVCTMLSTGRKRSTSFSRPQIEIQSMNNGHALFLSVYGNMTKLCSTSHSPDSTRY